MKKIFFAIPVIVFIIACSEGNSALKTDYNQMAKDLCSCMRPLADMNEQIKKLVKEGNMDEVSDLFSEVERISAEGEACANSLEEKYGVVEGESETKASAALKKHCPDIAEMLEKGTSQQDK